MLVNHDGKAEICHFVPERLDKKEKKTALETDFDIQPVHMLALNTPPLNEHPAQVRSGVSRQLFRSLLSLPSQSSCVVLKRVQLFQFVVIQRLHHLTFVNHFSVRKSSFCFG